MENETIGGALKNKQVRPEEDGRERTAREASRRTRGRTRQGKGPPVLRLDYGSPQVTTQGLHDETQGKTNRSGTRAAKDVEEKSDVPVDGSPRMKPKEVHPTHHPFNIH